MTVDASRRKGSTALIWGSVAAVCLIGSLLIFLGDAAAAHRALFKSPGSTIVLALALIATVIGTFVGFTTSRPSAGIRWGVALPLAILGGGVLALALGAFFIPGESIDFALGLVLAMAAIGMNIVAAQVSRGART